LFQNIKPTKEAEWRELFGGKELLKQKEADAHKWAAKKAEKDRKKVEKEKKRKEGSEGVEGSLKADDGVKSVTEGVGDVSLQTS